MNHPRRLSALLALWAGAACLPAQETAPAAPAADRTFMIADLRTELPGIFTYASWEGHTSPTKSGIAVLGARGAQGNGGFGREISPAVDFSAVRFVEVALGTIPGNAVPYVTIAVNDADGTQYAARIPVDHLVPGSPVWVRARRADFRLNDVEKGADGVMDWTRIARWHLQGDWTTREPMAVIFVALRARQQ